MQRKTLLIAGLLLIVLGFGMMAFQSGPTVAQDDGYDPTSLPEIEAAWASSGHADAEAEAFVHWDEDGEVSERCAACHSEGGHLDFLGVDGSDFLSVDAPAALGTVVSCVVCHNDVSQTLDFVVFPSGEEVDIPGDSARCMNCHQGRSSQATVDSAIAETGLEDMNAVSEDLSFINIHYYAAAASLYGSIANGGYEIEGNFYQPQFNHVEGYQECDDCHNAHTLELKLDECAECHDADDIEEVQEIRMASSLVDYDGDGDVEEGIYGEIQGLQEVLFSTIQTYAVEVAGTPIGYGSGYPYIFIDTDGDGVVSEEEGIRDNAYNAFTPNLLIAIYNYQVSVKDPGNYAHNAKYHIELLYDSTMLLAEAMGMGMDDMVAIQRDDYGHFNATLEAFRHWDEDGEVSGRCSRCHTAEGLPFELENGVTIAFEPSDSLECLTCHDDLEDFSIYEQEFVTFPSGAELAFEEEDPSNLCLNCHQGRNSGVNIAAAIAGAGVGDDEVSDALRFQNPHYFAGGASLFGADANGAYQFEGMEYAGQFMHAEGFATCADCHSIHTGIVQLEECTECHEAEDELDPQAIRFVDEEAGEVAVDYDGDGDATEGIHGELITLEELLLEEIIAYGAEVIGTPIAQGGGYPYWFADLDGNGVIEGEEAERSNAYPSWTPTLTRAIYNWQWIHSDPGGYAHNGTYLIQVMYDTLLDIGGEEAVAGMTRP